VYADTGVFDLVLVAELGAIDLVALADNPTFALLYVSGVPSTVHVMERGGSLLHVHPGAHLPRRAKQDTLATGVHVIEERLLLRIGLGVMNEGDLVLFDTGFDQVLLDDRVYVIDGFLLVCGEDLDRDQFSVLAHDRFFFHRFEFGGQVNFGFGSFYIVGGRFALGLGRAKVQED